MSEILIKTGMKNIDALVGLLLLTMLGGLDLVNLILFAEDGLTCNRHLSSSYFVE